MNELVVPSGRQWQFTELMNKRYGSLNVFYEKPDFHGFYTLKRPSFSSCLTNYKHYS